MYTESLSEVLTFSTTEPFLITPNVDLRYCVFFQAGIIIVSPEPIKENMFLAGTKKGMIYMVDILADSLRQIKSNGGFILEAINSKGRYRNNLSSIYHSTI